MGGFQFLFLSMFFLLHGIYRERETPTVSGRERMQVYEDFLLYKMPVSNIFYCMGFLGRGRGKELVGERRENAGFRIFSEKEIVGDMGERETG